MARIRSIKPEFWDSPGVETLHPYWRLLYIAMWNWADDSGRGKAEARELMGFVFPRDEDMTVAEFRRGLGEVRRVFGVRFYKVGGRSYFDVPTWDQHQKIDKRSGSRTPAFEEGQEFDPVTNELIEPENAQVTADSEDPAEFPPNPAEDSAGTRRSAGAGTEEQGNRGTGEEKTRSTAPPSNPPDPDPPPKPSNSKTRGSKSEPAGFAEFWEIYPRRHARAAAVKAFAKALHRADVQVILDGARRYAQDPNRDEAYTAMATTWLNQDRWADDPLPQRHPPPHSRAATAPKLTPREQEFVEGEFLKDNPNPEVLRSAGIDPTPHLKALPGGQL